MKAAVFTEKGKPLQIKDVPKPKPVKDQVLIKIHHAALNHRDCWIMQEQEKSPYPDGIVLGSDGSGTITDVGIDADPMLVGAEVIINPSLEWGNNPIVQGDSFKILGFPDHGTFAEYIAISKKYIFEKPENYSLVQAAAVPLSALTAYRALFSKGRLRAKEKVLITGIGGGAALWAMQFAITQQASVYVTSSSNDKIQKAMSHGAAGGWNYTEPDWAERAKKEIRGFDVIIDSAGGSGFDKLIDVALPGGRIVNFGRTAGSLTEINMKNVYWKQLSLHGTTMGTRDEFLSMLELIESRNIKPIIDSTYSLADINTAFQRIEEKEHFGKIVLNIQ